MMVVEGLLKGMQLSIDGKPLDRRYRTTIGLHGKHEAGLNGLPIEMDRAGAAHSFVGTRNMGASKSCDITNEIDEEHSYRDGLLINLVVDGDRDFLVHECFPRSARAKAVAITSCASVSMSFLRYSASAHMSLWVSVDAAAVSAALEIAEASASGHAEQSFFPSRRSPRSGCQPAYGQPSDAAAPVVAKFDRRANPDDGQRIRDQDPISCRHCRTSLGAAGRVTATTISSSRRAVSSGPCKNASASNERRPVLLTSSSDAPMPMQVGGMHAAI